MSILWIVRFYTIFNVSGKITIYFPLSLVTKSSGDFDPCASISSAFLYHMTKSFSIFPDIYFHKFVVHDPLTDCKPS